MKKASRLFKLSTIVLSMLIVTVFSCGEKQKEAAKAIEKEELVEVQEPFFKLSLAQWSLNKAVREGGQSPMDFAQKASELGFEGIEYVSQLYTKELEKDKDPKVAMANMLKVLKEKSETYKVENLLIMLMERDTWRPWMIRKEQRLSRIIKNGLMLRNFWVVTLFE